MCPTANGRQHRQRYKPPPRPLAADRPAVPAAPAPAPNNAICMSLFVLMPTCRMWLGLLSTMSSGVEARYSSGAIHCTVPKPPTK